MGNERITTQGLNRRTVRVKTVLHGRKDISNFWRSQGLYFSECDRTFFGVCLFNVYRIREGCTLLAVLITV